MLLLVISSSVEQVQKKLTYQERVFSPYALVDNFPNYQNIIFKFGSKLGKQAAMFLYCGC